MEWGSTNEADPISLPKLSDSELIRQFSLFTLLYKKDYRYWKVKISANNENSLLYALKHTSCIWAPKLGNEADFEIDIKSFPFYVSCGYYGFFKPSIYEIISQTPADLLSKEGYNAFYIDEDILILKSGKFQKATVNFVKLKRVHHET